MNYLLFFPSVTFGLFSAEIFPWAIIYSLVYLKRIDRVTLFLVAVLAISGAYTAAGNILSNPHRETDVIRSLAAYLNCILIFECMLRAPAKQIYALYQTAVKIFAALLVLGVAQYFALTEPFTGLIQLFVPRAEGSALAEMGDRGVTLLASEPARAGLELVFLYVLLRFSKSNSPKFLIYDLLFLLYVVVVIKSASASFFCIIALLCLNIEFWRSVPVVVMTIGAVVLIPVIEFGGRFGILLSSIRELGSMHEILMFLANESGPRLLAFYSFVNAGVQHPFGLGVGSWKESSVLALDLSGLKYWEYRYFQIFEELGNISVRAPGVLPNLMLDVGAVGVALFLYWVFHRANCLAPLNRMSRIMVIILLIKITLFGSPGEPVPWIVSALVLRLQHLRRTTGS